MTILVTYVMTKLIIDEYDDPFKILYTIRAIIKWSFLRGVLDCCYCQAFWITQVITVVASYAIMPEDQGYIHPFITNQLIAWSAYGGIFILFSWECIATQTYDDYDYTVDDLEPDDNDCIDAEWQEEGLNQLQPPVMRSGYVESLPRDTTGTQNVTISSAPEGPITTFSAGDLSMEDMSDLLLFITNDNEEDESDEWERAIND